ncbi:unnamed protein product, partial [Bubo scandiacus]
CNLLQKSLFTSTKDRLWLICFHTLCPVAQFLLLHFRTMLGIKLENSFSPSFLPELWDHISKCWLSAL